MALNNLGLGFVFTARDRATGTIRSVGNAFDQQTTRMRLSSGALQAGLLGAAAGVATMAAGVGTLQAAFGAAQTASEFGQEIARIGALSQASADELQQLEGAAIQAGIATQFSPREAAQGLSELAVRGFQAQESMSALSGVLDLAAGGGISVAQSAQTVGASLRVFGLEADQAGFATDRLLRISNVTALQANDLAIALGNVSRGAGQTQQSLEEMLPAIGLVRNTGVEASVASNSVSSALQFMARNSRLFRNVGVEVTNADGSFRNFLDIVRETDVALRDRFTNTAERAQEALRLFGRFGVSAFTGISQQIRAGIRNSEGEIVRGADAIDFLRESMRNADGAAEEFRERMLDTFEGQQTLLRGTVETLQTVTGGAFARVFRPFVTGITNLLNVFIRVFQAIPEPVQTALAGLVGLVGVFTTGSGAAVALGFAIALMIPFLKVIAITFGVIALVMAPVIVGIAALTAGVLAFVAVVRSNVGGIGDTFRETFERVRTAAEVMFALFNGDEVEGELLERFVKLPPSFQAFVQNISILGARISAFFGGIRTGFDSAMTAARPAIDAFMGALRELGQALGFVSDEVAGVNDTTNADFAEVGKRIGETIGRVVTVIVDGVRMAVQFVTGFVRVFRALMPVLRPVFEALREAFSAVGDSLGAAFGQTEQFAAGGREGASAAEGFGGMLASVVVPAIRAFANVMIVVLRLISLFIDESTVMSATFRGTVSLMRAGAFAIMTAFSNMGDRITAVFAQVVADILGAVRQIPEPIRDAVGLGTENIGGIERDALTRAREARARIETRTSVGDRLVAEEMAGVAAQGETIRAARERQGESVAAIANALQDRPVQVTSQLVVDGEVLARSTQRQQRSDASTSFLSDFNATFAED